MHRLIPRSIVCLREGYALRTFASDLTAGVTVAIIALPLAMALGIASIPPEVADQLAAIHPWLTPPAMGLFTAVVAGFVISLLGGSRVQVGGPTAACIPIVFLIASEHGYEGLATATLLAGVMVTLMGLFRFGAMIKFIPYPVTTGFTAGIAVTIVASQLKDFLGLSLIDSTGAPASIPPDFVPKLQLLARHIDTVNWHATAIGVGSLAILIVLRRLRPRIPGAIVVVVLSSVMVWLFKLDAAHHVETIGTRFGGIPRMLPTPRPPAFSLAMIREVFPSAATIAILCAIESLLSAVVADGMTGRRHKSDCELVAQGAANIASAFFLGLPATGAIARTVANIKSGGKTPVAGMAHAVILLLFMLLLADLARLIPLATLSAILMLVAWNISEIGRFRELLRAPKSDIVVLLITFALTVFTDLTLAVGVGVVLASLLFMRRMAEVSNISAITHELVNGNDEDDPMSIATRDIPAHVDIYEIDGPFYFGVADRLKDTLAQVERPPRVFILRMRRVPVMDATGLHALEEFFHKCKRQGTTPVLSGVQAQPRSVMARQGFDRAVGYENIVTDVDAALKRAGELIESLPTRSQ